MFKCNTCNNEFKSYKGLQNHASRIHKIPAGQTYVTFYYNGHWPVCKCGCGNELNFQSGKFGEYIQGHAAKVNGGFYSENGLKKSAETRKQRFASGEIVQWNKGKKYTERQLQSIKESAAKPERREKISKALSGKKKSPEHVAKIKADRQKYWSDREHCLQQRERRMQYIIKNGLGYSSNLEKIFKEILDGLGISYIEQFYASEIKALYDFKIKGKNILIEVDGDYWHCNPDIEKFKNPTQQWHYDNLERDKIKTQWASDNGYILLRFWENDIMNNRLSTVQKLIEHLTNA
jgi:G:T-mismatch repair DNA endonuclease (very short patch repair protein)